MCCSVCSRLWRMCSVCRRMFEVLEAPKAMRCVLLCMLEGVLCLLEDVGGDALFALFATLYAGGCGGCALFAGRCLTCWRLWM